jgi:hypothetical protein
MAGQQGIVVTIEQVYAVLLDVRDGQRDLTATTREIRKDVDDHEDRLRAWESRRWPLPVMAVLLAVASFGVSFIRK